MENELLNSPESRFQASLAFATSEFQGQIDQQGYSQIPNPYFPDIYASEYYNLVSDVLTKVKNTTEPDYLFNELIEVAKKRAHELNKQGIQAAKTQLAQETGGFPDNMPKADEYDEIERMWKSATE